VFFVILSQYPKDGKQGEGYRRPGTKDPSDEKNSQSLGTKVQKARKAKKKNSPKKKQHHKGPGQKPRTGACLLIRQKKEEEAIKKSGGV